MKKPQATFIGTVVKNATVVSSGKGKPFVGVTLKGTPGFGDYCEWVGVRIYSRDHDAALKDLKEGALVEVHGEVGARIREGDKPKAVLELVAFDYSVELGVGYGEPAPKPAPAPVQGALPVAAAPTGAPQTPEDDEVPF